MRILKSKKDIFQMPTDETTAVCITTNSMIKSNGRAVMGAGIARQANMKYHLDKELAQHLYINGNVPYLFNTKGINNSRLISFPTKYDWRDKSNLDLIRKSAKHIIKILDENNIKTCFMTPPGCGCGGLDWDKQVKPLIENLLDNRFIIVLR